MKKNRPIIIILVMLILTVLVVFLSCRYVTQVKNGQILKTVYLFNLATDKEKELTQSEFVSFSESNVSPSSSVIIETEKGKAIYKRDEKADSLTLSHRREWNYQMYLAFKNPNRAFTLDSLFQEELKNENIVAQTAVSFFQGDSLVSCSNESLCQAGIALDPLVFGAEHDPRQIKLQAYVLFPCSYLISQLPLIWGLILLWLVPVIFMYIWQRHKRVEYKVVVNPVTPIPAMISSDASEWIEIAPDVFFNKKTRGLKDRDHEVCLTRNQSLAFTCFLEAPDHTVSYLVFCKEVLGRPLNEDESTEENKKLNQAIRKSMTQTIQCMRKDLKDFPGLSIENTSGLCYRLNIKNSFSLSETPS